MEPVVVGWPSEADHGFQGWLDNGIRLFERREDTGVLPRNAGARCRIDYGREDGHEVMSDMLQLVVSHPTTFLESTR